MNFPIDLSLLTREEISQFEAEPSTLYEGSVPVCLYMRFSSEKQSEQSIEGQLRECRAFCRRHGYRIAAVYVDRATTARKDAEKRIQFQQMIHDSNQKKWKYVIVWKLDRFARNRTDSALYKYKLKQNGCKVLSATEAITDSPEGIIMEALLEGMAEFYSADLSQKTTRGMHETALKGNSTGGRISLGYKIENKKYVIDEATAPAVQEAFQRYANGETIADIARILNEKGYRTSAGKKFDRTSFVKMFRNERYIGVYKYKDIRIEDGIPAIIEKDLFKEVNRRIEMNNAAPGAHKAKVDYLLSGKLFCGHCGGKMVGESGKSANGSVYHYYACFNRKKNHNCDKKPIRKEAIEQIVAQKALSLLNDGVIDEIVDIAMQEVASMTNNGLRISGLVAQIKEAEKSIENINKAIEKGAISDTLVQRLNTLEEDKKLWQQELDAESAFVKQLEPMQIRYWLQSLKEGDINDPKKQKQIINLFVNSVTLYDDPDGGKGHAKIIFNLTSLPSETLTLNECSDILNSGSPKTPNPNTFIYKGRIYLIQTIYL